MIRLDKICEKLIWLLTLMFVVSFYLFVEETWGRYLYFGIAVCIFVLTIIRFKGVISFALGWFHLSLLLFAVYSLISVLWAWDSSAAISKFQTLMSILVCYSLIYPYYSNRHAVEELLNIVMWAGYVIAIYSIYYYGIEAIRMAAYELTMRLDNSYNNINSISMLCAFACVIQVDRMANERVSLTSLLLIPCIVIITAGQCRKALIILTSGILLIFIIKNLQAKDLIQKVVRVLLVLAGFAILVFLLSRLRIFGGVNQRIERLIASFTGHGKADHSSIIRVKMFEIGLQQFLKDPFWGIGIGSSHVLTNTYLGVNTYLHNNYIELLACGGIFGAMLYYTPYLALGKTFFKRRCFEKSGTTICAILLLLLLMWDVGAVSYNTKIRYLFMMIFFIQADRLKYTEKNSRYNKV